jgi:hypothetical protein
LGVSKTDDSPGNVERYLAFTDDMVDLVLGDQLRVGIGHPAHPRLRPSQSMLQVADLDLVDRLFPRRAEVLGATSVLAQLEMTRRGAGIGLLPVLLAVMRPSSSACSPAQRAPY